jgi:hypothetical protein
MRLRFIFLAAAVFSLVACGGGRKASTTNGPAASPAASPATSSYGNAKSGNAGALGTAEPVPALDCGGTQPVWVNERSHVFHPAGDPYYGRTKHGKYMCERDAAKAGYRPAKT